MADDEERQQMLAELERFKAAGEKDYDDLYEARSSSERTSCYSGAKENFHDAISLARRLGLEDEAEGLTKRLMHIKAVFRSQFAD
jgi:hypothetical protein